MKYKDRFTKDRDEAFRDVLNNNSTKKLRTYSKKYGIPFPQSKKVAIAGVMKAIQHCTSFTDEEKLKALEWCLDNGFNPFMKPLDWSDEE